MALQVQNAVKRIIASGGGSLVVPAGKSYLIKRTFCLPSSADTYLTLLIDKATVGYWRVKAKSGNHVPYPANTIGTAADLRARSLMDALEAAGHPITYPVAEGQTFTVSRAAEAGDVTLVYDIGDAGDYTSDQPNGSKAAKYQFVQYATNSAVITAAGDTLLDTQVTPSSFPQFPLNNKPVPANSKVRLLAIAGCPAARGNASANKGYTTFLKLIRDREVLFDEDRNGLPFLGDAALIANAETYDPVASVVGPQTNEEATPALVLSTPLEFGSGEELDVYVTVAAGASGGIAAGGLDVAFVLEVERAA